MISFLPVCLASIGLATRATAHVAIWHKSMYGFNVTDNTYPYDNRPQVPLYNMPFNQWWMHGHIEHPPKPGDYFDLPAGGKVNTELSCDKGSTSWYNSSQGGDVGYGTNSACVGAPPSAIHATGIDDVTGCGLAIAYQPDVHALQPEDFVIFSINHTCPWYLNTEFDVPKLPACPEGGCHCAWFWIHNYNSGAEQMYMNGFKCKVIGDVGTRPLGKPALPRRCGPDSEHDKPDGNPGNCTVGAKWPMYWYQNERNNMFEDTYWAPYYNDLYGFANGAQNDIFDDGTIASLASTPDPSTVHVSDPSSSAQAATTSVTAPPTSTPVQDTPTSVVNTSASSTSQVETSALVNTSIAVETSTAVDTSTSVSTAGSPGSTSQWCLYF